MISLIIPHKMDLGMLRNKIAKEYQTSTNIKSNSNRKSVKKALVGIREFLKGLKTLPNNGLALYSEQDI